MTADRAPRIVVVEAEGFPEPDPPWLPVGVVRWAAPARRLGVVVKATLHYGGGELRWAPVQEPLLGGEPSDLPGASPDEMYAPDDFVPCKDGVDVLVTGHAFAERPATAIEGALRIGEWSRPFRARIATPSTNIPLTATYLAPGEPTGPRPARAHDEGEAYGEGFDFGAFNAAPPAQRIAELAPDARMVLEGLARGRDRVEIELPGLAPVVTVSGLSAPEEEVIMRCDTLWIDTDLELVALAWRGSVELPDGAGAPDRIAVSLARKGSPRAPEDRLAALQRGRFGFAGRAGDERGEAPASDEERARLAAARYWTWASKAPPPRMSLAAYARLSALLAERPSARVETLAAHGLDEDRFAIEERAWLEKTARAAGDGDVSLADDLARALAAAQAEVAEPVELGLEDYAELRARLDRADDPAALLRERGLSIPQWMRVDQGWTERAEADPEVAAAIEAAAARAAGASGEEAS